MEQHKETVADKWRATLKKDGAYAHHANSYKECKKLGKLSWTWRKVFRAIGIDPSTRKEFGVFEFGSGGGKHLLMFALQGWRCVGIDCSEDVLDRARDFTREVSTCSGKHLDVEFVCGDFVDYVHEGPLFDFVYHVGAIEHFLEDGPRLEVLRKMFSLTKPGGFVVSIVPSGVQTYRKRMRNENLGGYLIPEIDYSPELMRKEFEVCGGKTVKIIPHNLFAYLLWPMKDSKPLKTFVKRAFYYLFQLVPAPFIPEAFAFRHAITLIGIARKPNV